jgi:hypothetical protein
MIFGASVAARGWHPGSCPPPAAELVGRTHSRAKVVLQLAPLALAMAVRAAPNPGAPSSPRLSL